MKIALYIEDGLEQIILSPESEHEKSLLSKLTDGSRIMKIYHGEFYACQGGWTRQGTTERSTIICLTPPEKEQS